MTGKTKTKPFIAKDTGKPLVVLGGYEIGEGGCIIAKPLPPGSHKPKATEADKRLLAKYGADKLKDMGYYGVIDRLITSGIIEA